MNPLDDLGSVVPTRESLNAAIRDNPLAAACIGAGIAWVLFGGSKGLGKASSAGVSVLGAAASFGKSAVKQAGDSVSSVLPKLKSAGADTVSGVAENVPSPGSIAPDLETADAVRSSLVNDGAIGRGNRIRDLQQSLADNIEKQPLLLGALGLAIGAAVGTAFASVAVEKELMGDAATVAREHIAALGSEARDRIRTIATQAQDEAIKQGLTPSCAAEASGNVLQKVKNVAADVGKSLPRAV